MSTLRNKRGCIPIDYDKDSDSDADKKKEKIIPEDFDEDMKSYADKIYKWRNEDLSEYVDNCIMHLRQALQHNQLVGKRKSITVFI